MTPSPRGGNFGVKSVKLMNFLKTSSLLWVTVQTKLVYSDNDQGRAYQNCKFHMSPGAGVLVLGCGYLSHIMKMHYFFKICSLLRGMIQKN